MKKFAVMVALNLILLAALAATFCFNSKYECEKRSENFCALAYGKECKCICENACISLKENACGAQCNENPYCLACYRPVACETTDNEIISDVFASNPCKLERRCYSRIQMIENKLQVISDLWLYDSCSGWLYEVEKCDKLTKRGVCGPWRCASKKEAPTKKVKYRSLMKGVCINARCTTTPSIEICEEVSCPFGCDEKDGNASCKPKAVIKTVPGRLGKNLEISKGDSVVFDCSESYDPDGTIVKCEWDFGAGEGQGEGSKVTHKYNKAGSYEVKLTVTDDTGLKSTETIIVNVISQDWPPVACFEVEPKEGIVGVTEFTLDANCSADPDIVYGDKIIRYEWSFGDGYVAEGKVVKHTYKFKPLEKEKEFTVMLRVYDSGYKQGSLLSAIEEKKIVVKNTKPVAEIIADKMFGKPPLKVSLKASAYDPDGHALSYEWQIGNNKISGSEIEHTFKEPGDYNVVLIVTDEYGAKTVKSVVVSVYTERKISALSAEDIVIGDTAKIFVDCIGAKNAEITVSKAGSEEVAKFSGVRCGTHVGFGPIKEAGKYEIVAHIPNCKEKECLRTSSFVVLRPEERKQVSEMPLNAAVFILLAVLFIISRRKIIQ